MKPSIGRIVHYRNLGSVKEDGVSVYPATCQAAIVTDVGVNDQVSLNIFYKTGQFNMESVEHSEDVTFRGTWHWPERTPE